MNSQHLYNTTRIQAPLRPLGAGGRNLPSGNIRINMDDRYVTIKKPNWRNYDIFFYEALYHALVEFLVKLKDGDNISKPIAHEDFVA